MLRKIETQKAPKAIGPYSQAISDGNYLFVSGQLPVDPETNELVKGDIRVLTNRVLDNIAAILEAGGCSFDTVVRSEVFLIDLNDFAIMNEEYGKRFKEGLAPARQTVQVSKLPKGASVEISCIALVN